MITRTQLRELARQHSISRGGFITCLPFTGAPLSYILSPADWTDELSLWPLPEIEQARRYLREGPVRRTRNAAEYRSSYFMKHQAEAWLREVEGDGPHCYVANGSMLIAALLEGVRVGERSGPNALIGVTPRRVRVRWGRLGPCVFGSAPAAG